MDLVIVGGAGTRDKYYEITKNEFNNTFNNIHIIDLVGSTLDEITYNVYNKIKDIKNNYIIVGHCLGGMVLLSMIGKFTLIPNNLKGLVLCNSYYDCTQIKFNDFMEGKTPYELSNNYSQIIKTVYVLVNQINITIKTGLSKYINNINRTHIPILIIGGTKDEAIKIDMLKKENTLLQNSILRIIQDGRHSLIVQKTKEVNKLLSEFMTVVNNKKVISA